MKAPAVVLTCALVSIGDARSDKSTGQPLQKRTKCGPDFGSCASGSCCSESGFCGTGKGYCDGPQCQIDYGDGCDTFTTPPGQTTISIPRPLIGKVPYGTIIKECSKPGLMALTFDDGPYNFTDQMLNVLDEYGVKATFFVSGNNRGKGRIDDCNNRWAAMLYRMHRAGHQIASHTWTHQNLSEMNYTIQLSEMINNEMAFRNLFGWFPTYMRPPYLECTAGSGCRRVMRELGYHVITANLDTNDYKNDDATLIQKSKDRFSDAVSTDSKVHDYITLAHDVYYQTWANITGYMIEVSRSRGYKLVTVGECLRDPKANWYRAAPNGVRSCTNVGNSLPGASPSADPVATTTSGAASATLETRTSTQSASSTQTQGNAESGAEGEKATRRGCWFWVLMVANVLIQLG